MFYRSGNATASAFRMRSIEYTAEDEDTDCSGISF